MERINGRQLPDVHGGGGAASARVRMDEPERYRVIVDRISHDIPFYRAYLKNAALAGTTVINNPFWWSADDKFFNYALATRLGRRDSADGAPAAQDAPARHHRPVDAQPAIPAELGRACSRTSGSRRF